jgi:hypothetical protein
VLTVLALALAASAPAVAAPRRAAKSTAKKAAAAAAFAKASRLFKARDYLGALEAFIELYRLAPHFLIQCNIARCHERLSDMVSAATHYRRCLREGAAGSKTAAKVAAALKIVEGRITWVNVRSQGKGGKVFVDGKPVGDAPQRVAVNPGDRMVEVRREGATAATRSFTARGGESLTFDLAPTESARVEPGPKQYTHREPEQEPRRRKRRGLHQAWFWAGVGLTAGLAAGAAVMGWLALSARNEYVSNPTREGYNTAKDRRLIANILWGATGAAGAGTTALFFLVDFKRKKTAAPDDESALVIGVQGTF